MGLSRRAFLASSLAALSIPTWASAVPVAAQGELYFSAFSKSQTEHFIGAFAANGKMLWSMALPKRAHAPVVHPTHSVVGAVARRPGFYMDFFNPLNGEQVKRIEPTKEHHFYGHAVFTQDGHKLITQENHYPTGQGKIVIRAWPSAEILAEYDSGGIGPHESVLMNQDTLVIANGGLKTHPDNDREILNLETMAPNATYLSLSDGRVLQQVNHAPELHKLSVRHLDVNQDGVVALGFQYQGELWENVPLVALSRQDSNEFTYLDMPEPVRMRFKQYCGSVCFDKSGETLAISTPRGGFVAYWDVASGAFLRVDNCRDVCGLVATANTGEFVMTSGTGKQLLSRPRDHQISMLNQLAEVKWDNHLRRIDLAI
ncbi:DUF1513 domain-containing protein [Marinomonas ostreistagni]|uniref:DUF1513 domain-containing protein n=1 Tax=Marinomonas ostreistagni TaxID=359209 RepID=UPI0019510F63|nr:DUF1513 domain-containing protein [Marinomonas ostreistagni]MBM6550390.1 DUF1513 domain-containing protein [Marinomonas ostreistagni]